MREKSIGGARVAAAPISLFAMVLTRELNYRRYNISHRVTAKLPSAVASVRVIRHFVTDRTSHRMPKSRPAGHAVRTPKMVRTRKAHTGNVS